MLFLVIFLIQHFAGNIRGDGRITSPPPNLSVSSHGAVERTGWRRCHIERACNERSTQRTMQ